MSGGRSQVSFLEWKRKKEDPKIVHETLFKRNSLKKLRYASSKKRKTKFSKTSHSPPPKKKKIPFARAAYKTFAAASSMDLMIGFNIENRTQGSCRYKFVEATPGNTQFTVTLLPMGDETGEVGEEKRRG
jgi:hypothetical protein